MIKLVNPHHLVAPRIDDLDRHPFMLADVEGKALGAGEGFEGFGIDGAAEGFGEFLPGGLVREEGLADAEGAAVVVGIQEPSWNIITTTMIGFHRDWIEYV